MKRLKCPKCGEVLESVERFNHCVEYANVSITEDGNDVETNIYNDAYNHNGYRCTECQHEDDLQNFIVDSESCKHNIPNDEQKYFEYGRETGQRYIQCTECNCILKTEADS